MEEMDSVLLLPTLQKRSKWFDVQRNLKVGDLVLLIDNNALRNQWSRGRVTKVLPNKDGLVRRIELVTPDGRNFLRDIRQVCLLEIDGTD